jgi:hypothetical protein
VGPFLAAYWDAAGPRSLRDADAGGPQGCHGIYHAVRRISSQASERRNIASQRVADEGTQSLITAEIEEFVLLDRPARHAAVLLQHGGQLGLGGTVEEAFNDFPGNAGFLRSRRPKYTFPSASR